MAVPRDIAIDGILVIGSGPVRIGQAAEFDYSGTQACLSFREEGLFVVLLNPNPASIQTDEGVASRVYIEPITPANVASIMRRENLHYIYPAVGGQTALNVVLELNSTGLLKEMGIKILGTPVESIKVAEDRERFSELVRSAGDKVAPSRTIWRLEEIDALEVEMIPCIGRTSFSLGGSGGRIFQTREELREFFVKSVMAREGGSLDVQKSLEGMKEFEYELVRDSFGNRIAVCNMENLDPMGVHTGESIVVTPAQTIDDKTHQRMRNIGFRIIDALGIIGACNIQFALSEKGDIFVVELNPRTSRSSALASKASGYPISRVASKLVLGYSLAEVKNPVTGTTFASFEPSLDYVTVKIPRWPFEKFAVSRSIGVQMKSIGEVMGIGRTFEEALMKAIASLETVESLKIRNYMSGDRLMKALSEPSDLRLYSIFEALFQGMDPAQICRLCHYDAYFIRKMKNIVQKLTEIEIGSIPEKLVELKKLGVSDGQISSFTGIPEVEITRFRIESGIVPSYRLIDTCSGEFKSSTPYYYSTYCEEDEFRKPEGRIVLIVGAGPNRIGQGVEFDYSAVKAVQALKSMGLKAAIINSNPETVSTDFDISDALFFEPVTLEHTSNLVSKLNPEGVIVQFSGQTGQNMAAGLGELFGENILRGTKPSEIFRIEERNVFARILAENGIDQPEFVSISNEEDFTRTVAAMEPPYIMRSSFIIGGRAMDIISDRDEAIRRVKSILAERPGFPVLVSKYIEDAEEIDIDFVAHGPDFSICGIMPHIEEAGTHSGDATMILSPSIESSTFDGIRELVSRLCTAFRLDGLCNLQVARKGDTIFVIELNARASRSIPFVSKASGTDWVKVAVRAAISGDSHFPESFISSYFLKVPVFPFDRYEDLEPLLGPEMKSTGEAMLSGKSLKEAVSKACSLIGINDLGKGVVISVKNSDKPNILGMAKKLSVAGIRIYATPGTHEYLRQNNVESHEIFKMEDVREPKIDEVIRQTKPSLILNTPSDTSGSIRDGFRMRRVCVTSGVTLVTNARLGRLIVESLLQPQEQRCRPISEYRQGISDSGNAPRNDQA